MSEQATQKPLSFEMERMGDNAVVKCHGRLVWGQMDALQDAVKQELPQLKQLVLDLQDVSFVDSSGLGLLVRLYVSGRSAGCEVKLLHLRQQLRNLLKMAQLTSVLDDTGSHGMPIA